NYRDNYRVAELAIPLSVRHRDMPLPVTVLETHKPRAFGRSQPARPGTLLGNQDLRPILVVSGRQCPGDILLAEQAVTEAVAGLRVLGAIRLQIVPQLGR